MTTDPAGCSLSSELQGLSDFLVLVTGTFSTLAISLIGAIFKKLHHFFLLTYFWLHCFPSRIAECQSWKEDHLVHLQRKKQAQSGEWIYSNQAVTELP